MLPAVSLRALVREVLYIAKDEDRLVAIYGATRPLSPEALSVLEPVEVPHCAQRYSYRFPVGNTRSRRWRVGVA